MGRYRKPRSAPKTRPLTMESPLLGILYIVGVRFEDRRTREITKQKLLMVGCEAADIERKLRWMYDADQVAEFSITGIEKVREKVHMLSTVITQPSDKSANTILREEGRQEEVRGPAIELPDLIHYAVGLTTRIWARDHYHALRKIAAALNETATQGPASTTARLSADSQLTIEEIPKPTKYTKARDVSHQSERAKFVRG